MFSAFGSLGDLGPPLLSLGETPAAREIVGPAEAPSSGSRRCCDEAERTEAENRKSGAAGDLGLRWVERW